MQTVVNFEVGRNTFQQVKIWYMTGVSQILTDPTHRRRRSISATARSDSLFGSISLLDKWKEVTQREAPQGSIWRDLTGLLSYFTALLISFHLDPVTFVTSEEEHSDTSADGKDQNGCDESKLPC